VAAPVRTLVVTLFFFTNNEVVLALGPKGHVKAQRKRRQKENPLFINIIIKTVKKTGVFFLPPFSLSLQRKRVSSEYLALILLNEYCQLYIFIKEY
jgi:hypothetical protein